MCINAYWGDLNELQEVVQLEAYSQILIPGLSAHTTAHTDHILEFWTLLSFPAKTLHKAVMGTFLAV